MEKPLHTTIADACRACMLRQVLAISCFGLCSHVLLGDITDALCEQTVCHVRLQHCVFAPCCTTSASCIITTIWMCVSRRCFWWHPTLFRKSLFEYFAGIVGCLGESSHMTRHDPRKQSQENNFGAMSLKFIFLVMVLALLLVIVLVFSSLWFCL